MVLVRRGSTALIEACGLLKLDLDLLQRQLAIPIKIITTINEKVNPEFKAVQLELVQVRLVSPSRLR